MLLFLTAVLSIPALAAPNRSTVEIGLPLRKLALELPEAVPDAFRARDPDAALTALADLKIAERSATEQADLAFLRGWAAIHSEDATAAAKLIDQLDAIGDSSAPEPYRALVQGEVLRAAGEPQKALKYLKVVGSESTLYPRAAAAAAESLRGLDRTKEAIGRLEDTVSRPDPADGNAEALLALAELKGVETDDGYTLLRRLWTYYPTTSASDLAKQHLSQHHKGRKPTLEEVGRRAERWMRSGEYDNALLVSEPVKDKASAENADACRIRFVRGRSAYKRNRLSQSIQEFGDIGRQCADVSGAFGPSGLYLIGTAQFRRKEYQASADAYAQLVELYSGSTMADDALTRGGISLLEGGQVEAARALWERALTEFSDGDTVPEATLRLAFAKYDEGDTADAIRIAEKLAELPKSGNAVHIESGRYWAARWRYFPDRDNPTTPNSDEAARAEAIERWVTLCRDYPHSFYALLATSRLRELAPDQATALDQRPTDHTTGADQKPWHVRYKWLTEPAVRDGIALMRLGLVNEAQAELARSHPLTWQTEEMAFITELRIAAGDWLLAHDDLRAWIIDHPLTTLGDREAQIIRLAYPDRYYDEVLGNVKSDYRYDPRLFHALVREESNFNREIVSFAGARGLSQLMWATAKQTAGWLGMTLPNKAVLFQPNTNLKIGGRYLDAMHKQLSDSPFLALAAYNGGATNVKRWVAAHDNPPTDEWVERVPFRETRGYIKRVMGTWQTMRYHFDVEKNAYADLSKFNHEAMP
ncbi:MAG: transglycosylase SLT domain-containing protein [Myxococcota bacterium]